MTTAILREQDPVAALAPLLGPRVGLRASLSVLAVAAPFALRMPPSGTVLVTFTAGEDPQWNVEAMEGLGFDVGSLSLARKSREWAGVDHAAFVGTLADSAAGRPP